MNSLLSPSRIPNFARWRSISATKPGTKVDLTYVRDGQPKNAKVTVADRAKLFSDRTDEAESSNDEDAPTAARWLAWCLN